MARGGRSLVGRGIYRNCWRAGTGCRVGTVNLSGVTVRYMPNRRLFGGVLYLTRVVTALTTVRITGHWNLQDWKMKDWKMTQ